MKIRVKGAAEFGNLDYCLKYARENGCEWDQKMLRSSSRQLYIMTKMVDMMITNMMYMQCIYANSNNK